MVVSVAPDRVGDTARGSMIDRVKREGGTRSRPGDLSISAMQIGWCRHVRYDLMASVERLGLGSMSSQRTWRHAPESYRFFASGFY
jgi:hypothetical protein